MHPVIIEAIALGLIVNPYSSAIGAVIAAMICTRSRTAGGVFAAAVVLLASWAIGDLPVRLGFIETTVPASADQWLVLVASASVGVLVGYALPAWAGAFVGRRVTWGTGWLAAGVVAASAAGAVYAIGNSIASSL